MFYFLIPKLSQVKDLKEKEFCGFYECVYLRMEIKIHILYSLSPLTYIINLKNTPRTKHIFFGEVDYFHSAVMQE